MNEDLILTLQNYWFSEKEAKIYLTALSLWAAPASTIARNANESRTTVYSVLWDLVKKWFCSSVVRENVTYFSAVSPEILVKIQEQKYEKIKEKLPEFMSLWNIFWWLWKIKTFEWKNALKNLFLEMSETEVDVKYFQWWEMSLKNYPNYYPEKELEHYRTEKIRKGIKSYRILSDHIRTSQAIEHDKDLKKMHKRETLIVPWLSLKSKTSIHMFWPNKVSIEFFNDNYPFVIIMENTHIYEYMTSIFDYIWKENTK